MTALLPINIRPSGWRKGQTMANFLIWLHQQKGFPLDQSNRMADLFHLSDEQLEKLYLEFLKEHIKS